MCRDRVFRVATWFPGMLGRLGRDKGFLFRDRVLFGPMSRQKFCVAIGFGVGSGCFGSRQGPSCVTTKFFPMGRTFLLRQKILCRNRVSLDGDVTVSSIVTYRPGQRAQ